MKTYIAVGTLDYKTYKKDKGLHLVVINEKGELKLLDSRYDGFNPSFVAAGDKPGMVYGVSERLDSLEVAGYELDREREKLQLRSVVTSDSSGGVCISLTPKGKHLAVPCWKSSDILVCALDSKGNPAQWTCRTELPEGKGARARQIQSNPHQVVFDISGRYAVVPDLGADCLHIARWDEDSGKLELTEKKAVQSGDGPRHGVFHPKGPWFYLFSELGLSISVYEFDYDMKNMHLIQRTELIPEDFWKQYKGPEIQGAEVKLSPEGRFLFASIRGYFTEKGEDRLVRMEIDSESGKLSLPVSFSCKGHCPRLFEFSPDGHFMLVCNQEDGEVVSLSYDLETGTPGEACDRVKIEEAAALAFIR